MSNITIKSITDALISLHEKGPAPPILIYLTVEEEAELDRLLHTKEEE